MSPQEALAPFAAGCRAIALPPPPEDEPVELGAVARLEILRVMEKPGDPTPDFWLLWLQPGYHAAPEKAHLELVSDWEWDGEALVLQGQSAKLRLEPPGPAEEAALEAWRRLAARMPTLIGEVEREIRRSFGKAPEA